MMARSSKFLVALCLIVVSALGRAADYTINFSAQSSANPYVVSSPLLYMYGGTGASDAYEVVNGSGIKVGAYGSLGVSWGVHNVAYGNLITSEITIPAAAFSGDNVGAGIFIRSGTGIGAGYILRVDGSGVAIDVISATGTLTQLTSSGSVTAAASDVFKLTFNQTTGDLNGYQNGTLKVTFSADNTYTSPQRALMGAGWYSEYGNINAQYISVFAATGVVAGGVTVVPSAASLVLTGSTPALTASNNKIVTASSASLALTGGTPTISASGNKIAAPSAASLALSGATPTITKTTYTWYPLPAPGGYDSNSILAGQTYPTGSWLRVVTDFGHITAVYATGPLQNDINDYSTAESGYTGTDSATYEIKNPSNSTSQYTVTANIDANALIGFSAASMAFSGATPSITFGKNLSPTAAALGFTGATPTLAATANKTVSPASAALALSPAVPSVVVGGAISVAPSPATVALAGAIPSITTGSNLTLVPAAASVAFAGSTPAVAKTANYAAAPSATSLNFVGVASSVSVSGSSTIVPIAAVMNIAGAAPAIVRTQGVVITPIPASLSFSEMLMKLKISTHTFVLPPRGTAAPGPRISNPRNRPAVLD